MARLELARYELVLQFLAEAMSVEGESPFPVSVLQGLRRVVPCDAVSFREWQPGRVLESGLGADDPHLWRRYWPAYPSVRDEDPLAGGATLGDSQPLPDAKWIGRPLAITDMISEAAFRRGGLYAEMCKPLGVRAVIKLFLPTEGETGSCFVFDTTAARFTHQDKVVLTRLAPYLVQLRRNAQLRSRCAASLMAATTAALRLRPLTPRERTILARVAAGETNDEIGRALFIGPSTVRKHLQHIYEKLDVPNRAAATAVFTSSVGETNFS